MFLFATFSRSFAVFTSLLQLRWSAKCSCIEISSLYETDPIPAHFPRRDHHSPVGRNLSGTSGLFPIPLHPDLRPWHDLIWRLESGQKNMTILVIGGSLTAGHFPWFLDENADPVHGSPYSNKNLKCSGLCLTTQVKFGDLTTIWNGEFGQGDCKPCAWPARLQDWLQKVYPDTVITVHNMAVGGTHSEAALGLIGHEVTRLRAVDLAIVAYSFNDWAIQEQNGETRVAAAFEELIRLLLEVDGSPTLLILEFYVPDAINFIYPPHGRVAEHYRIPVISFEYAAMRNDVFESLAPPLPDAKVSANGEWSSFIFRDDPHPPWPYHQLMADLLAYAWRYQQAAVCKTRGGDVHDITVTKDPHKNVATFVNNTQSREQRARQGEKDIEKVAEEEVEGGAEGVRRVGLLPKPIEEYVDLRARLFRYCLQPLTLIEATGNTSNVPFVASGPSYGVDSSMTHHVGHRHTKHNTSIAQPWQYGEDVAGNQKYGWWVDDPFGGEISFNISLPKRDPPVISFGFLESHEHMGAVRVYLDGDRSRYALFNASNKAKRISVMRTEVVCFEEIGVVIGVGGSERGHRQGVGSTRQSLRDDKESQIKSGGSVRPMQGLSSCNASTVDPQTFRFRRNGEGFQHSIHFELIPNISGLRTHRNKFKIYFISTC